jgi:hypothetical protein
LKWFKHDTTALHDAKIEKLIMKYGIQGYGLYFACVEIIAGNLTNENINFELEHDAEILAYKFRLDTLLVQEMMKYMVQLRLFESKNNKIYCYKLASRIDSSLIKNKELLQIKKGIQEDSRSIEKVQELPSQKRREETRLDKNRKEKEAKKSHGDFVVLANNEYLKLCNQYSLTFVDSKIDDLNNYIGTSGKKYKSHYYTLLNWCKKDWKEDPLKRKKELCASKGCDGKAQKEGYCFKCLKANPDLRE